MNRLRKIVPKHEGVLAVCYRDLFRGEETTEADAGAYALAKLTIRILRALR